MAVLADMSLPQNIATLDSDRDSRSAVACRVSNLDVTLLRPSELDGEMQAVWNELRSTHPTFASPFFSLEFVLAAEKSRGDVVVLVVRHEDRPIGFLPIQFASKGHAVPVGGAYNDSHGLLFNPQVHSFEYLELLKLSGLKSYTYHAVGIESCELAQFSFGSSKSFLADLQSHPEGYVSFLEQSRETIFKQRRKTKKMIRDLGPLRLEFECQDPMVLQQLIDLKRSQYRRTNIFDLLSIEWIVALIKHLYSQPQKRDCRGIATALYAGETLVAGHVGIIEGDLLHYWFPTYDPQFHAYSPGTALFLETCNFAKAHGVKKIDFGYGEQPYKTKLTDTISTMHFGRVDVSKARWLRQKALCWLCSQRKAIPFRETIKKHLRKISPDFGAAQYR